MTDGAGGRKARRAVRTPPTRRRSDLTDRRPRHAGRVPGQGFHAQPAVALKRRLFAGYRSWREASTTQRMALSQPPPRAGPVPGRSAEAPRGWIISGPP